MTLVVVGHFSSQVIDAGSFTFDASSQYTNGAADEPILWSLPASGTTVLARSDTHATSTHVLAGLTITKQVVTLLSQPLCG